MSKFIPATNVTPGDRIRWRDRFGGNRTLIVIATRFDDDNPHFLGHVEKSSGHPARTIAVPWHVTDDMTVEHLGNADLDALRPLEVRYPTRPTFEELRERAGEVPPPDVRELSPLPAREPQPAPAPAGAVVAAEHLARIDRALDEEQEVRRRARVRVQATAREAQAAGVTWQQIADHLSITKQAAWKRLSRPL